MTDEERQESRELTRKIFGVRFIGDEVHCQGRAWKLYVDPAKPQG